jgi:hypothetical protein
VIRSPQLVLAGAYGDFALSMVAGLLRGQERERLELKRLHAVAVDDLFRNRILARDDPLRRAPMPVIVRALVARADVRFLQARSRPRERVAIGASGRTRVRRRGPPSSEPDDPDLALRGEAAG